MCVGAGAWSVDNCLLSKSCKVAFYSSPLVDSTQGPNMNCFPILFISWFPALVGCTSSATLIFLLNCLYFLVLEFFTSGHYKPHLLCAFFPFYALGALIVVRPRVYCNFAIFLSRSVAFIFLPQWTIILATCNPLAYLLPTL